MKVLLIGIGNEYRSDDGVGRLIARNLMNRRLPHIEVVEASGEGAALMETWKGADAVILIDAVSCGAPPGTIHRLNARRELIPQEYFRCSTHAFGVAEAIEMARALNLLPPRLIIYGIEGQTFAFGQGLSAAVEEAAGAAEEQIHREVQLLIGMQNVE
jgi:hydrogenase maturation protease